MIKKNIILISFLSILLLPQITFSHPFDYWVWRNPLPQVNTLRAISYGKGIFVAVGYYGTIIVSEDAIKWQNIWSESSKNLYGITFGQDKFVAVGEEGTIISSKDGRNWTLEDSKVKHSLFSITYEAGKFIAVGQRGLVIYSEDGKTWKSSYPKTNFNLTSICYDRSNFFIAGNDISFFKVRYVLLKSSDLTSWEKVSEGDEFSVNSITCKNNKIIAVGITIDREDYGLFHQMVAYSHDSGLTFRMKNLQRGVLYGSNYFRNLYVAVGHGGVVLTSEDGENWDYRNSPIDDYLFSVISSDNLVVAVGDKGKIINSKDGINWQEVSTGIYDSISDITYCDKKLVSVSEKGNILISKNGINWTVSRKSSGVSLNSVICVKDTFIAIGDKGLILTSNNGIDWIKRESGTDEHLYSIVFDNNKYIIVGGGKMMPEIPTSIILTSYNGIDWSNILSEIAYPIKSVAYGDGLYIAASKDRIIYKSTDGIKWSKISLNELILTDVVFTGQNFIAVGGEYDFFKGYFKSVILTSIDGSTWDKELIDEVGMLNKIKCHINVCAVVGELGIVMTKDSHKQWQRRLFKKTGELRSLEFYNNSLLIVGNSGTIIHSKVLLDDVQETDWSYDYINKLFKHSITYGCDEYKFCPDRIMTRGESSAFLIRASFGEDFNYTKLPYFADVPVENVFFKYIQKMKDEAVTKVDNIFFADNPITRGEFTALLIRLLYGENFSYPSTPYFVDVQPHHHFFKYIQKSKFEGLTKMTNYFNLDGYLTRKEAAAFTSRGFSLSE
ncbi:MAG TPA: hypothetical protein HPP56_01405 [Nitrospirae bacterium]|nr:hypothetical protein [Nitrospirota bacterium]